MPAGGLGYQQAPDQPPKSRDADPHAERDPEAPPEATSPLPALHWHPFCSPGAPLRPSSRSRTHDGLGTPVAGSAATALPRARSRSPEGSGSHSINGSFRSSKLSAGGAGGPPGTSTAGRRPSPTRMLDSPSMSIVRARMEWEARQAGLGNQADSKA